MIDFGKLKDFVEDPNVTDINFNGTDVWIDHLDKGRCTYGDMLDAKEALHLAERIANCVNQQFNGQNPVLEADLDVLRVSILHPSVCGNVSISIRKSYRKTRFKADEILNNNYISRSALKFLEYAIQARANIMISGLPGAGKTELLKFLTDAIDENERVVTIEDSYELHYQSLHPTRDAIMLKVNNHFSYHQAIKASLRQRADWILLSEVRGHEVIDLLNAVNSGTHLISTIHAQSAKDIPKRLESMVPNAASGLRKSVKTMLDVGVHIDMYIDEEGIQRRIREIVVYEEDKINLVYHYREKKDARKIPQIIKEKALLYGVKS
ncbi:CpaF/VirB11 family protein [Erysipelothrix urinaevulpis]|uniref:CpaF/VirB11 family protein n=1 Tax=Erysipelothrix urinaevulpis TaxID=2683717 RepID=UPI001F485B1E|nr:CpaF/VirB11 family protein [Erysipelothrix urinaevulpis]